MCELFLKCLAVWSFTKVLFNVLQSYVVTMHYWFLAILGHTNKKLIVYDLYLLLLSNKSQLFRP